MISHYIKTAWRSITKNKLFSLINISGLSAGLAVFMLIMLWVRYEMSYNNFHTAGDRIALLMTNQASGNNEIATFPASPTALAAALKKDLPSIELAARCSWGDTRLLTAGSSHFSEFGLYTDPDFFDIFSFNLVKGSRLDLLKEPNTIVLTEKLAKKYFGDHDPVGQTILVENSTPYKIQAVLEDVPAHSTIYFDFLMPMQDYIKWAMGGSEDWGSFNIKTFIKLQQGAEIADVNSDLNKLMNRYTAGKNDREVFAWKLKNWYLRYDFKNGVYAGGGRIAYVRLFVTAAVFILLLACINFMNLSTARATQRAKEVGVRKVVGAGRFSLARQFVGESMLLATLAGLAGLLLTHLALPFFNAFLKKQLVIDYSHPATLLSFAGLVILTGLLAGSYPASVLSAFNPARVLKGESGNAGANTVWIRKSLVVLQFTVSVLLIIGTIVIHRQVHYIKNKDIGYNREHLLWMPNTIDGAIHDGNIDEFRKVPGVTHVCRASMTFTSPNNRGTDVEWPGKIPGEETFFSFIRADHDLVLTMGIEVKEGRSFSRDFPTDTSAFILNEEAVKRMKLINPVGQIIETYAGKGPVVGVVKNFHIESLHSPVSPVIIECRPRWTWLLYARIDGHNTQETISGLEATYKRLAPGTEFSYEFQDKEYERLFKSELQIGTLVNWFSFFAIFISCLGLYGLTVFTVERKTREIGIRKVLGASVSGIVSMLSKDFVKLVLIAAVIAFPLAGWMMNLWLQDFAYRIEIQWWMFAAAALAAIAVAIFTVAIQAIKAAVANPVKSLRAE